jgi:hypothetical protein
MISFLPDPDSASDIIFGFGYGMLSHDMLDIQLYIFFYPQRSLYPLQKVKMMNV